MASKLENTLLIASTLAIASIATGAFSRQSAREIKSRANGVSELSGATDRPMERSHLNHDRNCGYYDNPRNGLYVTDLEHLAYHSYFRRNPEKIGLTRRENWRAIQSLMHRVLEFNIGNDLDMNIEIELQSIKQQWWEYLNQARES